METAAEILISALLKIGNSAEYTIEMIKNDPEYKAIIEVIESLQEENKTLKEKEIRGDRMIVDLEHKIAVMKARLKELGDDCPF